MNLAKEISFLLYKHNCVILPGFGAFLINEKAAERNEIAKYALPKQEVITFNRQIINNDGLVANHLSQTLGCSYELGLEKVENYIAHLWTILKDKRNAEVSEVGTFYFTQEEKLIFVPYHSLNFSRESFGLPKLRLKEVSSSATALALAPVVIPTPILEPVAHQKVEPVVEKPIIKKEKKATPKRVKARREAVQVKKLEKQTVKKVKSQNTKRTNLSIINTLGGLFLIGMIAALFNFEMNNSANQTLDHQVASLLDSPSVQLDPEVAEALETIKEIEESVNALPVFGIYADVKSSEKAEDLKAELEGKYAQTSIETNDDGKAQVFIISFSSEELAKEYKSLIQNKINHKLVIKQK